MGGPARREDREDEKTEKRFVADRLLREGLMPDEPEDLWTVGLAVDKAVAWWEREGRRIAWPGAAI